MDNDSCDRVQICWKSVCKKAVAFRAYKMLSCLYKVIRQCATQRAAKLIVFFNNNY